MEHFFYLLTRSGSVTIREDDSEFLHPRSLGRYKTTFVSMKRSHVDDVISLIGIPTRLV